MSLSYSPSQVISAMDTTPSRVLSHKIPVDPLREDRSSSTLFKLIQILSLLVSRPIQWLYQRISSTPLTYSLCDSCLKLRIQLAFSHEFKGLTSSHGIVLGILQNDWRSNKECVLCRSLSQTTYGTSIDTLLSEAKRQVRLDGKGSQLSFQLRAFPLLPHLGGVKCQNRALGLRNEVSEYFLAAVPQTYSSCIDGVYEKALRDQVTERGYLVCHQSSSRPLFTPRLISSLFDPSVVEDWLSCCQVHHMHCLRDRYSPRLHRIPSHLNLIDCESRRIVRSSTSDQQTELEYVALSYIWSKTSNTSTFLNECSKLPVCLPRAIEDAILVTLSLGYRFIWVDRYCIDQHDAHKKHEQIMHMDSVYQYAALTIIAAAGNDETYGLPGVSRGRSPRQGSFKGAQFSIASTLPPPHCSIRESRWATRGWTYQEAVLSTRRLVFTDDQLYFECNSMSIYESLHVSWDAYYSRSRPYIEDFLKPRLFSFGQSRVARDSRHQPFDFENFTTYTRCAEQYSRRTLRFDSDSLNAFSGIIRKLEMAETSPVSHVWGIPFFHSAEEEVQNNSFCSRSPSSSPRLIQLLHVETPVQEYLVKSLMVGLSWRHEISAISPRRRLGFPSWSWVGWEGSVMWPNISRNSRIRNFKLSSTSVHFKECTQEGRAAHDRPVRPNELQNPRMLCLNAAAMCRDAFILGENPRKFGISTGGEVCLYPSKPGLDAVKVLEGIQAGRYEVIRLAAVGTSSYLMLVELEDMVAYRVGTLVTREFYLTPRLFKSSSADYRII
ncbi:heterokaryon incompatibility protein-domain-containing protein [Xylaria arbuscula]|nr:heterokaryon incompatibility protein-domain-containing protein [Xylaria arbuscula]